MNALLRKLTNPHLLRIASNLGRMVLSLVIGLVLVRLVLGIGAQSYALYALIVAGFGLAILMREMLRVALIAPMNAALEQAEGDRRAPLVHKTLRDMEHVALAVAVIAGAIMALVAWTLPQFGILPEDLPEARRFVLWRGAYMVLAILAYPVFLYVLAQRRQLLLNLLLLGERVVELSALLLALRLLGPEGGMAVLGEFAWLHVVLSIAFLTLSTLALRPRPVAGVLSATGPRALWQTYRADLWNGLRDILAPMMFFRFDLVVLSAIFGPATTVLLGLSVQFTGYVRQASLAMVGGLEALFGRAHFAKGRTNDNANALRLMRNATTLQAFVVFFLGGFLFLTLEQFFDLWLSRRVVEATLDREALRWVVIAILPGIIATGLGQTWTTMLTGAGKLGEFVPYLFWGAFLNPVLLLGGVTLAGLGPVEAVIWAALLFSAVNLVNFTWIVPRIAARILGVAHGQLMRPALAPFLGACLTTLVAMQLGTVWAVIGCFALGALVTLALRVMLSRRARG